MFLDNQKKSYVKVFKESIREKEINESMFLKFSNRVYLPNAFGINQGLDIRNSYSIIVYNEELNYHVLMVIYSTGKIRIIYDYDKEIKKLNNSFIEKINLQCSQILKIIIKTILNQI